MHLQERAMAYPTSPALLPVAVTLGSQPFDSVTSKNTVFWLLHLKPYPTFQGKAASSWSVEAPGVSPPSPLLVCIGDIADAVAGAGRGHADEALCMGRDLAFC
jgi:hypothetical protein